MESRDAMRSRSSARTPLDGWRAKCNARDDWFRSPRIASPDCKTMPNAFYLDDGSRITYSALVSLGRLPTSSGVNAQQLRCVVYLLGNRKRSTLVSMGHFSRFSRPQFAKRNRHHLKSENEITCFERRFKSSGRVKFAM